MSEETTIDVLGIEETEENLGIKEFLFMGMKQKNL